METLEDSAKFDEITEERLRNIITWENFEQVLMAPRKSGGLGFKGQTPHHITKKFRALLAEEGMLPEQHANTTS